MASEIHDLAKTVTELKKHMDGAQQCLTKYDKQTAKVRSHINQLTFRVSGTFVKELARLETTYKERLLLAQIAKLEQCIDQMHHAEDDIKDIIYKNYENGEYAVTAENIMEQVMNDEQNALAVQDNYQEEETTEVKL